MAQAGTDKKRKGSSGGAKKDAKRPKRDHKEKKSSGAARRVERKSKKEGKWDKPPPDPAAKAPRGEVWSKSKKKRMRLLQAKIKKKSEAEPTKESESSAAVKDTSKKDDTARTTPHRPDTLVPTTKGASSLQKSYAARLSGSRFRILNEELYTTTSSTAFENFRSNPELFTQYHEGFRHQVENWPSNPVDVMLAWLTKKYANNSKRTRTTVVADFGCGDAELAKRLLQVAPPSAKGDTQKSKTNSSSTVPPFQVHSFDLVAGPGLEDLVTACDMSNVPLAAKSVDVAIFCLALMGTNVADFLVEVHRVLKDDGKVKIAEVRSRFESASGKDDLDEFAEKLQLLGFECQNVDRSNKMFIMMELTKNGKVPDKRVEVRIKVCL